MDDDVFVMSPSTPDLPTYFFRAADTSASGFAKQAWVKDIGETKATIGMLKCHY